MKRLPLENGFEMGMWPYSRPRIGLNIGSSSVAVVEVRGRGRRLNMHRYKVQKYKSDLLVPSPSESNIKNPAEFREVIQNILKEEGVRRKPISLSLPDLSVKVLLLKFDRIPKKAQDLDQLIRWNMEKTFLTPLKDGRLSYQILKPAQSEGSKFLILGSMIQRDILDEYEELIRSLGCYPVLIDISSFHVFNLCRGILSREMKYGDGFLFVNVFDSNFTIMILHKGMPDFIRIKGFRDSGGESHVGGQFRFGKISEEIETSMSFYSRDQNPETISHLFLFGERQMAELIPELENRFHLKVSFLDPQAMAGMGGFASVKQEEYPVLIPALGAAVGR